jgi:DNA (cytosine-5)-methyltransferase 1
MISGEVYTCRTKAVYKGKKRVTLGDILEKGRVDEEFYIDKSSLPKWDYLKGSKKEKRVTSSGFEYNYAEGAMIFPDDLNKPSRTIITSEGGASPSRFRHVVKTKFGLRRLTPLELERLNMFPDNFTKLEDVSNSRRGFLMGNALVVGIVKKIGDQLIKAIN